jgi:hypothetical protein
MGERFWLDEPTGSEEIEDMNHQPETPEDTATESKWDYWHTGLWRIDMDKPCERDIEIEPVLIYEAPFPINPFHIRFSEELSAEDIKKYLRAFESWIDGGGLDATRD